MRTWDSPIYGFYEPIPEIEEVGGRRCHVFICAAAGCRHRVRRYLDTHDKRSTSNLRTHSKKCWGDVFKEIYEIKNLKRVRAAVSKLKNSPNGNVAAKTFEHGEERFSQLHASPSQSTTSTENARKLEPGRYIMTGINSGMTLDLRHDNRTLYAYQFHGKDNQQVRATITRLTLESGRAECTLFLLSSVIMTVRPLLRAALHTTHMIVCHHFGLTVGVLPVRRRVRHQQRP